MPLRIFRPSPLLAPYVTAIWDYDNLLAGDDVALSILPDTASYLCFLYRDPLTTVHRERRYTTRSGLAGFQSYRSDLGGTGDVSGVSARLSPWGLSVFRRGVVVDCAEHRVDCRDLFPGGSVERLEDELAQQASPRGRVACIEAFLLSHLNPHDGDRLVEAACRALNRTHGVRSIASLASALALSERSLERRFRRQIGTTPKTYARIVRLRAAVSARGAHSNWADVAHACGYFDQSHLIRDAHHFYGLSPDALQRGIVASGMIQGSGLLNLAGLKR
ncbi:MAG: helix-turn-helix domain-containing protein [Methylotetracoccus sp.]